MFVVTEQNPHQQSDICWNEDDQASGYKSNTWHEWVSGMSRQSRRLFPACYDQVDLSLHSPLPGIWMYCIWLRVILQLTVMRSLHAMMVESPPPPTPSTTRDEPPLGSEHSAHVDMNTRYRMFKTDTNIVRSKLSWQHGELIFLSFLLLMSMIVACLYE